MTKKTTEGIKWSNNFINSKKSKVTEKKKKLDESNQHGRLKHNVVDLIWST